MVDLPADLLRELDGSGEATTEMDVWGILSGGRPRQLPLPMEWLAEIMAFEFCENYDWSDWPNGGWRTYFGPRYVLTNDDGTTSISPALDLITSEVIQYWKLRAEEVKHPVLRARYAALAWDMAPRVDDSKRDITCAHIWIDSVVERASRRLHRLEAATFKSLEAVLKTAITIKDRARTTLVRDAIIEYETAVGVDENAGMWGHALRLLANTKRPLLSENQERLLVLDMESRLARLARGPQHQWGSLRAAETLASYYRSKGQSEEVARVLLVHGRNQEHAAEEAEPLVARTWLADLRSLYLEFGLSREVEELVPKIRAVGRNVKLNRLSAEIEISGDEMNAFLAPYSGSTLEQSLNLLAKRHLMMRGDVEVQLRELSEAVPLQFLFTKVVQDAEGRPVTKIGGLDRDQEGNVVHLMAQNLSASAPFLRVSLSFVLTEYRATSECLTAHVSKAPIFSAGRRSAIKRGLAAYLDGEVEVAAHVLLPQIEAAVRVLVESGWGCVLKPNRLEGFNHRMLGDLLRDPIVERAFGGEAAFYMRVVLTDPRGWNLRNQICHGLGTGDLSIAAVDRIIHIILLLSMVRRAPSESPMAKPNEDIAGE